MPPHLYTKKETSNKSVYKSLFNVTFQAHVSKVTAFLHDWRTNMCGLYPGTKHLVRVRAQDLRAQHHWSSWSGFAEAITAEKGEEQIE